MTCEFRNSFGVFLIERNFRIRFVREKYSHEFAQLIYNQYQAFTQQLINPVKTNSTPFKIHDIIQNSQKWMNSNERENNATQREPHIRKDFTWMNFIDWLTWNSCWDDVKQFPFLSWNWTERQQMYQSNDNKYFTVLWFVLLFLFLSSKNKCRNDRTKHNRRKICTTENSTDSVTIQCHIISEETQKRIKFLFVARLFAVWILFLCDDFWNCHFGKSKVFDSKSCGVDLNLSSAVGSLEYLSKIVIFSLIS